jgi:Zn-dependent membrane protease YugP
MPVGTVQVSEPVLFQTSDVPVEFDAAVVVPTAMLEKPLAPEAAMLIDPAPLVTAMPVPAVIVAAA